MKVGIQTKKGGEEKKKREERKGKFNVCGIFPHLVLFHLPLHVVYRQGNLGCGCFVLVRRVTKTVNTGFL
jgi:hypothetical protein